MLAAAAGLCLLAVGKDLAKPSVGLALAGACLVLAALVSLRSLRWRPGQAWWACTAAVFLVLFVGIYQFLPANARRYSVRGHVRSLAAEADVPVACYPHGWDSVRFYLPKHVIRAYGAEERARMIDDMKNRPETLVVIKSGRDTEALIRDLPASLEFIARGRQGAFSVGMVRLRATAPYDLFAENDSAACPCLGCFNSR
jgi:hypothetical protein